MPTIPYPDLQYNPKCNECHRWTEVETQRLMTLRARHHKLTWLQFYELGLFPGRTLPALQARHSLVVRGRIKYGAPDQKEREKKEDEAKSATTSSVSDQFQDDSMVISSDGDEDEIDQMNLDMSNAPADKQEAAKERNYEIESPDPSSDRSEKPKNVRLRPIRAHRRAPTSSISQLGTNPQPPFPPASPSRNLTDAELHRRLSSLEARLNLDCTTFKRKTRNLKARLAYNKIRAENRLMEMDLASKGERESNSHRQVSVAALPPGMSEHTRTMKERFVLRSDVGRVLGRGREGGGDGVEGMQRRYSTW